MPSNVEMLYLLSMVLRQDVMRGVYLGRMLNVLLGVLCALSIWAFGRRFVAPGGSRAGAIGGLLFLSCPWFYWILTTDREDRDFLARAAARNPRLDRLTLLRELARRYPHGVVGRGPASRATAA